MVSNPTRPVYRSDPSIGSSMPSQAGFSGCHVMILDRRSSGLNGSGKSNILDAICFVLGISNLTQVRVGNLSELVYKQGQAGVTKASVTIVFNNEDKQNSPVGWLGCCTCLGYQKPALNWWREDEALQILCLWLWSICKSISFSWWLKRQKHHFLSFF